MEEEKEKVAEEAPKVGDQAQHQSLYSHLKDEQSFTIIRVTSDWFDRLIDSKKSRQLDTNI